jgi:hypothetical protein
MFTVTWRDRALNRLADFYVAVDPATRQRIADGVAELNNRLAADPWNEGESRTGNYRSHALTAWPSRSTSTGPEALSASFG